MGLLMSFPKFLLCPLAFPSSFTMDVPYKQSQVRHVVEVVPNNVRMDMSGCSSFTIRIVSLLSLGVHYVSPKL